MAASAELAPLSIVFVFCVVVGGGGKEFWAKDGEWLRVVGVLVAYVAKAENAEAKAAQNCD